MRRSVSYTWQLRELMASHGMWKTTDLAPLLAERGVELSPAQVYRLVTQVPERLSLHILAALCDIFSCTPNDLVETSAHAAPKRKAAGSSGVVDLNTVGRPRRARVHRAP
ncbi:MAG TPA: helix-turn-helix transcriptional regulator [Acidimicrobiales bacterium]|nr:helix-turn-helix transcriptional regulator [Acidimicrobiales bacterium]